ncbi:hypothetical protein [Actinopolyspora mortivallis]|uniref:hypothetical protein n=1 Tax=Actinopolyspora mortivallis TaxID=33906 RepID=UPI000379FFF0|nr:hypothetical protein [Actinopolyspora mortivallis]
MSGPSAAAGLAELLMRGVWLVEQTAYEVGGRRATAGRCRDVAEALDELSAALREHAETRETAPVPGENSASYGGTDA